MKIIIVSGYDCCVYIHSIWINEFLKESDNVNLGDFGNDDNPTLLIDALRKAGFKLAKTQVITFGGNL